MTTWTYDGVDLSTFGSITMLDDYLDLASRRGGNQTISNRHGTIHVPKFYDETEIAFGIAMNYGSAALLEQAFDDLKKLLSSRGEKILANTRADASVRTALASCEGKIQPKRESYKFARVVVIFKLAQPFFFSSVLTEEDVVVDASPKTLVVDNEGTVEKCNPTITLTGPLLNPSILNTTNGVRVTYTGTIASPRVVTIQEANKEIVATDDLGANVIGNLTHEGSEAYMVLEPGTNSLEIEDDTHTTGGVGVAFYAPYL